ncbi:SID1 transmembrane family member 1-like [Ptychodera flava]|uniref:SID1 transmembrane family member 1-like n=1 Tax=Ptychodera flava TaxID=63121 RepID=UPI003969F4BC
MALKISLKNPMLLLLLGMTLSVRTSWGSMSTDGAALTTAEPTDSRDNSSYQLDTLYHGNVSEGEERQYVFQVRRGMNKSVAVRVEVNSSNAVETYPVMFVVTQQEGIISWKLPLEIMSLHKYDTVARTLCPMNFGDKPVSDVLIRVTGSSPNATDYSLIVTVINDFEMELSARHAVMASPSRPQYYYFKFPEGVEAVQVRGHSKDKICATISVQKATCPVFDLLRNVKFIGMYQTVTMESSIHVQNHDFDEVFIVIVVHPSDQECTKLKHSMLPDDKEDFPTPGSPEDRIKNVTIDIIPMAAGSTYWMATLVVVSFFIVFYILYGIILLIKHCRSSKEESNIDPNGSAARGHSLHAAEDSLINREDRNNIDRVKPFLSVADLCKKSSETHNEKYKLYCSNLIPIAIFYALPVIQLVFAYQNIFHDNGDEDICYYNFLCANPLGVLSSFNNVFSNIGYVLLGILFLIITRREEKLHQKSVERYRESGQELGLPRYFGIFYAIGIALIMEGIHSACYHVCPSHSNFQFDTSYMYIMVGLSMLKLYQARHPDITSTAHVAYICLALVILVTVIGVVFGTLLFWIIVTILHIVVTFVLTAQIYYVEGISYERLKKSCEAIGQCDKPQHPARIVLLVVGNIINLSFALYGVFALPDSFATHLLYIFLANAAWYIGFYISMKFVWGERILPKAPRACVFLVLNVVWVPALYFFVQELSHWGKTPAESREGNRECLLFDFYDDHDVWHMLSACGLFFTFMILLTLDDDIDDRKPRDEIPVF